jgi:ATP-binding cassette subfamily B protein
VTRQVPPAQRPASVPAETPARRYVRLLRTYAAPEWRKVTLLGALLAGAVGLELAAPQILRHFVDTAGTAGQPSRLVALALLFVVASLALHAFRAGTAYVGEDVAWAATNRLRLDVTTHCLRLDLAFHQAHPPGELIERVDGDVALLARFLSRSVPGGLANLSLLVGVLGLLFLEDWRLGVAFSAFAALAAAALAAVRRRPLPQVAAEREVAAGFYGWLAEALAATEDVRAAGAGPYVLGHFHRRLAAWLPARVRAELAAWTLGATASGVMIAGRAAGYAVAAWLWATGAITVGGAYVVVRYADLLAGPIDRLREQVEDLQAAGASLRRLDELLGVLPAPAGGSRRLPAAVPLAVELDGVSFAYGDDRPGDGDCSEPAGAPPGASTGAVKAVLSDVSFALAPGRVLGVLGRTGAGKTTLARLLVRQLQPTAGRVLLGGVPLSELDPASRRAGVGMVTQDVELFHAAVRDNLTLFGGGHTDEELWAVLDLLGLAEWCRGRQGGLDGQLSPGALSAGEGQLLAMGRLLLRDPGLVVLDEASSRLDPATERHLEWALDRTLRGRTAVVIAHRLATLDRADDILILDAGRVQEHGPREALAADPTSRFAALRRSGAALAEVLA